MPEAAIRVLIADDEVAQMQALCDTLAGEGFAPTGVTSGADALLALRDTDFELLLTDLMMPGMDGVELLRSALTIRPNLIGIVMTGQGTIDSAVQAMQAGALDFIQKPFKLNFILPVLRRGLAVRGLRLANAELERRIGERTLELEAANRRLEIANQDLEAFAFSVSHDLRAPLRAISGFLELYMTDHATEISSDGRQRLLVVEQSAARMNQLIEDLLTFSRLSRQPLRTRPVSMRELAQRIARELSARQPQRHVEVVIDELPECAGDASLLEQVWVNLLSNAFKFTRDRSAARIEVGCRVEGSAHVYYIKDNGTGFDEKYAGKLFGVFQRLHSAEQFEGTGVGLSIVDRIVRRHGGRAWAEGQLGHGATFFFSIPLSDRSAGEAAADELVA